MTAQHAEGGQIEEADRQISEHDGRGQGRSEDSEHKTVERQRENTSKARADENHPANALIVVFVDTGADAADPRQKTLQNWFAHDLKSKQREIKTRGASAAGRHPSNGKGFAEASREKV
jgi:hypothetical protein